MALALGVQKDGEILIGGKDILTIKAIRGLDEIVVSVRGREYTITDKESTEVLPNVRVSTGVSPHKMEHEYAKLAFSAPRSIAIVRMVNGQPVKLRERVDARL